ncbi:MAG TPA: PIG-L family deacetylase [Firmicutes bacterium]|nr:PIG-L family deacetylase [Bacillota bacterium]
MRHASFALLLGLLLLLSGLGAYYWVLPFGTGPNVALQPFTPALTADDRVLVFAPHPDDETVGAGGLIQLAVAAGARVRVVFFTCGDAFRYAAQRRLRLLRTTPASMRAFGRLRQKEALAALQVLGVPAADATFLGFPDRGLAALWEDYWASDRPYRSPYTGVSASPYSGRPSFATTYTGQAVLASVEELIRSENPTLVLFPGPHEGHPDHWAAGAFVTLALEDLKHKQGWSGQPRLYTYLVHYSNWPRPWGANLGRNLEPPPPIAREGVWLRLDLPWGERVKKYNAILKYQSQVAVMRGFLTSFARSTELFGAYPPAEVLVRGGVTAGQKRVAVDVVGDSVIDRLDRDADITELDASWSGDDLNFWLHLRGPVNPELDYRLEVVALTRADGTRRRVEVRYPTGGSGGTAEKSDTTTVHYTVPLRLLGNPVELFVTAETYQGRIRADRLPQVRIELR